MTDNVFWIVIVVALGLPSAIVGLFIRRLENKWQTKEDARLEYETLMIELTMASLTLAQATATAVQTIPETHCNGEMSSALDWSQEIKKKYHQFTREQTAKAINT